MNRTVFILLIALQTAIFLVWENLGYRYGGVYLFIGFAVLLYFRRRYLNMKPYWAGDLADIPKYFTRK
ncbi:hypothetical protein [Pontibacter roseus]|uniref:hypothetical protein n=1 Tax=Pontibacter roseus TaxID=336989 RepID=UPI000367783E|nr:hypothetical protein [Pontibacter roseus]